MKNILSFLLLCGCALAAQAQSRANELHVARGNEDYPPNEMHVGGKLTGLHIEVVEAVAAKLGKKVVWDELPWLRAQKCAEEGACDAISYISQNEERDKWAVFLGGNVLSRVEMRFVVHKADATKLAFNGNTADYLNGKTLVTMAGYTYGPVVAKAKKYEVKNLATLAGMVAEHRYDVAIVNVDDFAGLKGKPQADELTLLSPPAWESNSYIAFSRAANGADLAAKFQAAYADFKKSKEYQALLNRFKTAP
ncbi:MAG: transporter substrate-binding domain-containing protein [Rhodoferax sp.]|nr:transporter substrate-binding domain-containing protein [Rhodoferax sp.]